MKFHEKLQLLRKQKHLTQEELASALYVSRTAISKWESGRGYPNIDSLKAIATFFSVTVDELLSGEELLTIAEETGKEKESSRIRDIVFGLLDLSAASLLFLPLFAQRVGETVREVSLLELTAVAYLHIAYWVVVMAMTAMGVLALALQNCRQTFWAQIKSKTSLLLNVLGALLFVISLQPYAAVFLGLFLTIKVFLLIKKH